MKFLSAVFAFVASVMAGFTLLTFQGFGEKTFEIDAIEEIYMIFAWISVGAAGLSALCNLISTMFDYKS